MRRQPSDPCSLGIGSDGTCSDRLKVAEGGMTMRVVRFRYQGRVGHFLRAEMNASALSYPVPPRTALLGLWSATFWGWPRIEAPERPVRCGHRRRGKVPRQALSPGERPQGVPVRLAALDQAGQGSADLLPTNPVRASSARSCRNGSSIPISSSTSARPIGPAWMADLEARLCGESDAFHPLPRPGLDDSPVWIGGFGRGPARCPRASTT